MSEVQVIVSIPVRTHPVSLVDRYFIVVRFLVVLEVSGNGFSTDIQYRLRHNCTDIANKHRGLTLCDTLQSF